MIRKIIAELLRPSTLNAGPLNAAYTRAVIGIAHAMLGAALVPLAGPWIMVIPLTYWLAKESFDLKRGGGLLDGLEDTLMVWLGAFYGPWWWPVLMIGCGGYLMAMGAWRVRP